MKYNVPLHLVLQVALLATQPLLAQSLSPETASALSAEPPAAPSRNRIGLSYRVGFNAPVTFKNTDPLPAPSLTRFTPDGAAYNYDNGYVLTDSSGNAMGYTRYWGYDTPNQDIGSGSVVMQRSLSVEASSSSDPSSHPMSGFELSYDRELLHKKSWRGGLEGTFGMTFMSVHDASTDSATVTQVNDVYSLAGGAGAVVPPAPYMGRYDMPGPVILATPSSSVTALVDSASISGEHDFSAHLFGFQFGPYLEVPISKSIAFSLSGGFALVYVNSDFSFSDIVTTGGISSPVSGSGSHSEWRPGGYVAGNISVALSEKWSVAAGVQFQDVGRYTQKVDGMEATLDLSKTIFATVGITYSF